MASKKSAPKSAAKKARPEKKVAAKRKPAARKAEPRKPAARKAETARAGEAAAKSKEAKKARSAAPAPAAKPSKAATPAAGKERRTAVPAAPPVRPRKERSGPPRTVAVTVGSGVVSKLGTKWSCFQCGSRFYDLNKPEPLCPRCGADQRERPKVAAQPAPSPPAPKKAPRPMAPLLDDEDDGTVRYDEEFDLGVRADIDEAEEELFPPGEAEEEDVFGPEED